MLTKTNYLGGGGGCHSPGDCLICFGMLELM